MLLIQVKPSERLLNLPIDCIPGELSWILPLELYRIDCHNILVVDFYTIGLIKFVDLVGLTIKSCLFSVAPRVEVAPETTKG